MTGNAQVASHQPMTKHWPMASPCPMTKHWPMASPWPMTSYELLNSTNTTNHLPLKTNNRLSFWKFIGLVGVSSKVASLSMYSMDFLVLHGIKRNLLSLFFLAWRLQPSVHEQCKTHSTWALGWWGPVLRAMEQNLQQLSLLQALIHGLADRKNWIRRLVSL